MFLPFFAVFCGFCVLLTWRGAQGCMVTRLHRARFGEYGVEGLAPGEWRVLPLPPWSEAAREAGGGADPQEGAAGEAEEDEEEEGLAA